MSQVYKIGDTWSIYCSQCSQNFEGLTKRPTATQLACPTHDGLVPYCQYHDIFNCPFAHA